jgi:hypothetical protein
MTAARRVGTQAERETTVIVPRNAVIPNEAAHLVWSTRRAP